MGYSVIIASIVAASIILLSFFFSLSSLIANTIQIQQSLDLHFKVIGKRVKTVVEILNNTLNSTNPTLYILNKGYTDLLINCTTLYINGTLIKNYTEYILNDYIDRGIWNPNETLVIRIFQNLTPGITKVTFSTCEGVKYSKAINVT